MKRTLLAGAALLLTVGTARADDALAQDVGVILSMQLYSIGLMDYCFEEIEKRPAFKEASQKWQERNAEAMTLQATLLPKVAKAEEIAAVVIQIRNAIAFDVAAQQQDKAAACQTAADSLNAGDNDIAARAPESLARIKAAVNAGTP